MKNRVKIGIAALILISGSTLIITSCHKKQAAFVFETIKAETGSIRNTVTATGTLEAIKTVEVGTQVSGVIKKIYADFNDYVKAGQLLAELDKTSLMASQEEAKAVVANAEADLEFQTATYNRIKALFDKQLVAKGDYDQALVNYHKSEAGLITSRSQLARAKVNLAYATIRSPINGVILNRAVNEGQTVAASFNTPTLFTIANDLTQMQVEAAVAEADIGQIADGQYVTFEVDAYPAATFKGSISEIRLKPVVTNNVVTYTVIVTAPNPEKKLMPGMTASITVLVNEAKDVVTVPDQALMFTPNKIVLMAYFESLPIDQRPDQEEMTALNSGNKESRVWIKDGKSVKPVKVEVGIDNGTSVEIKKGLKNGDELILSLSNTEKTKSTGTQASATSPFMPKRPGQTKK